MALTTLRFPVSTRGDADVLDLTGEVARIVEQQGFLHGQALVFVSGSTAGLTTLEFEPGLRRDLPELFERLAPRSLRNALFVFARKTERR